jgi:hypothetical protein
MRRLPQKNLSILFGVLVFNYETLCTSKFDLYLRKKLKSAIYEA